MIGIACDHAGYQMKEELKVFLSEQGYQVKDFGTNSEESMDYPDVAHPLANSVESGECEFGIALCGSGNGISMTLNKHQQIRAALCWNSELAALAKQHNNANILSLPARFISLEEAKNIVRSYIDATFEGGRHQRRVEKIACK
ncbi:MAG: ribose 5-phosphate isomerase B [Bacteroidales bacterium]|jgi:ribose 5-phosphate isomerase B|nr:ribose 5-phosphate isomerase B [Bacteroidales bacterium]MBO7256715.1 ribose 5-phosphate isomerase B [Bacteroidales bacterium]MBO7284545.1 ribose 5-phosphate isomerase B [Bacteroidales bacterium]MBO7323614.1 ribose 5-phosphate isomerase B [Bacteroidales bacterium]MBQ1280116.1 ribose 5-phosphate isomerase B [Bacteroidales bacterium]